MKRGYLALYRKIQDHPFYKERREFSKLEAWVDLLMEVQHEEKPQEVLFGMKVLFCNYGESLKSVLTWARRWKWTESKVRRFLKLLKKMEQIDVQSEVITTRVSVLNYSIYDPKRRASEGQMKCKRSASDGEVKTDKHISIKTLKNKDTLLEYLKTKIKSENLTQHQNKIIEFYNYRQTQKIKNKKQPYKSETGINGLFRDILLSKEKWIDLDTCLDIAMEKDWLTTDVTYFKDEYFNNRKPKKTNKELLA